LIVNKLLIKRKYFSPFFSSQDEFKQSNIALQKDFFVVVELIINLSHFSFHFCCSFIHILLIYWVLKRFISSLENTKQNTNKLKETIINHT